MPGLFQHIEHTPDLLVDQVAHRHDLVLELGEQRGHVLGFHVFLKTILRLSGELALAQVFHQLAGGEGEGIRDDAEALAALARLTIPSRSAVPTTGEDPPVQTNELASGRIVVPLIAPSEIQRHSHGASEGTELEADLVDQLLLDPETLFELLLWTKTK